MSIRSAVAGLAASFVAACSGAPEGLSAPDPDLQAVVGNPATTGFVTGSVHWHDGAVWSTYEIHARLMPDGTVDGTWQSRRHRGPLGGAKRHGRVTCMVVEGNQAWLGGVIEKAIDPNFVGDPIGFRVVDNGTGAGAAPDLLGRTLDLPSPEWYCSERPETALAASEVGDIRVHVR